MATAAAMKRLNKEYKAMQEEPVPYIVARPRDENILEWHYIITGPPETPYAGGQYHGILQFPRDYPFKPPGIKMITPSGRFRPNTRLCLSISDYHPESWNPAWTVETILTGLLSFMTSNEITTGGLQSKDSDKIMYAAASRKFNATSNRQFMLVFPDFVDGVTKGSAAEIEKRSSSESTSSTKSRPSTSESTKAKRKHSSENLDHEKKSKAVEVVNLDSDEDGHGDGDAEHPVVLDDDDEEDGFYNDYDPFSSDDEDGGDDDNDSIIMLD